MKVEHERRYLDCQLTFERILEIFFLEIQTLFFSGSEDLFVVTGKKINFSVSSLGVGEEIPIKIKNTNGFAFGLCDRQNGNTGGDTMKHVLVKMFDAQEVPNGKEIKIARSYVSVVTTDGREHRLQSTGTKHFRDADYIPTKDWLQWAFGCVPKTIGPFARALGL